MIQESRQPQPRHPDFFIVGAPKSGTTSMWGYLRAHPEIYMPRTKEPHRFGSDLKFRTSRITEGEYLALFSGAADEKRIGEASVWYLYSHKAAEEIRDFAPSADIIVMLRNPVDMIYSLHRELVYQGSEDLVQFESALEAEFDRRKGLRMPRAPNFPETVFYRRIGSYAAQVRRYINVFGRQRIHVVLFDDLARDPAGVYKETLRFLGVDSNLSIELPVLNRSKGARSKIVHRLLHDPPRWLRRVTRRALPRRVRVELGGAVKRANMTHDPRPPMDPRVRRMLVNCFAPDTEELECLIGRDLSQWRLALNPT